jgi:Transposase DDE domain group 1
VKRRYFRGDAAFANPEIYKFLEAEGMGYVIRLPANRVLQDKIGYLLKRPVGRPPHEVRRYYASFSYQAQSWKKPRRVVAKVECPLGELYPRVGFIVTNLARPAERVVAFYNQRGTAEQWIKEGKGAIKWDPAVMPFLRGQRRPPSAPRARLQPLSGGEVICDERRRPKSALMRANRPVPAPRRSHLAVSTASCRRRARLPLPKTPERAILRPTITGNPGNVG